MSVDVGFTCNTPKAFLSELAEPAPVLNALTPETPIPLIPVGLPVHVDFLSQWHSLQAAPHEGTYRGIARQYYNARELEVKRGDEVFGLRSLNGWMWCERTSDGQTGWVPLLLLHKHEERI